MNRTEKEQSVGELSASFGRASVAVIANGQGLSVPTMQGLRREIRRAGGEFKVAKNTLLKLAIRDTSYDGLGSALKGPTAVVFGYSDPIAVVKLIVKFAQDHESITLRAGVLESQLLQAKQIEELATLPSREVVLAQLLGLLQAPATQLVRLINEPAARVARVVDSLRARLEAGGA